MPVRRIQQSGLQIADASDPSGSLHVVAEAPTHFIGGGLSRKKREHRDYSENNSAFNAQSPRALDRCEAPADDHDLRAIHFEPRPATRPSRELFYHTR
jgi:hypothetical protein